MPSPLPATSAPAESIPAVPQLANRPTTITDSSFAFECHFSQLLLESSTQQTTYGCGSGNLSRFWQQSRLEAHMVEVVLAWAERGGEDPRQTLASLEESDTPASAPERAFLVGDALRIRLSEQKVAVEIATRLHESRHPEEREGRQGAALTWGYPPPGASGAAMAAWSEVERFLTSAPGALGLGGMAERLASLRATAKEEKNPAPAQEKDDAKAQNLYAPVWKAVGARIEQARREMTQLQALMLEPRNPFREGMLDLLLSQVHSLTSGEPPAPEDSSLPPAVEKKLA